MRRFSSVYFLLLTLLLLAVLPLRTSLAVGPVTLTTGHLLIADPQVFYDFGSDGNFDFDGRGGILSVNPSTGVVSIVSKDSDYEDPNNVVVEADPTAAVPASPNLLVVDPRFTTAAAPAVLRVNLSSGETNNATVLSSGVNMVDPRGITVGRGGTIYVADTNEGNAGKIIAIDPTNGNQTVLVSTTLVNPTDLVFVPGANATADRIYVADPATAGGTGTIYSVTTAGAVTSIATGSPFIDPVGITVDANGTLYVADADNGTNDDRVIRITTPGGTPGIATVTHGNNLGYAQDVAVEASGNLVVTDPEYALGSGALVRVTNTPANYPNAAQTAFAEGDSNGAVDPPTSPGIYDFIEPVGIAVVPTLGSPNTNPTISAIADQTINEDGNTGALPFTVGDAETAAGSLTLSATSTNTSLVPVSNIVFGGSGASRTVTVTPVANGNGTATITITVTDAGNLTASEPFLLTVNAVNDNPTISAIADQTINEDGNTGALPFTVGDVETAAGSLTLSAASTNTSLVPVSNIVFGGSGASRTVTVTPVANGNGTATITITVMDANGGSAQEPFLLTVNAVNDNPTISAIADQTISEDGNTGALPFTIDDLETAAGSLALSATSSNTTLVPVGNIVFGGSGASRTVTVTPAANQFGTSTITVIVTDANSGTAQEPFLLTVNAVNDNPTISAIADQSIDQDTNTGPLAFTVGDLETPVGNLMVSGSSNNTTLVPNANIVFGGSGASRTVTVTPAAGQVGMATITVTVSDGMGSADETFLLTVNAVNNNPTISDITNQTINEDGNTGALPFTINDVETPLGSLMVSGSSSNTTLVPNANIVFGGSNGSRTVTVTPAANQFGTATITVTVMDADGGSASDTFLLTVNSVNDNPTISDLGNQTISEDGNTGALPFTVGDVETAAGSLMVSGSSSNTTLVPNANIVFGGSGSSRTVTVTPAANQFGMATITVTVMDADSGTASDTFVLTVNSVNDDPTVSDISNQTIDEDGNTGALPFTIDDVETPASSLMVSGSSSNTTLVPNANIVFGGSNGSRTVTVTPAADQFGTATITVTVMDADGGTASDTFLLTVNAVNDAPSFTKGADQTVNTDAGPVTISGWATALSAGPANEAGQTLTFQVTGNTNPSLFTTGPAVNGTNGNLTFTPAGTTGTATITLQLMDNGGTDNGGVNTSGTQTFTITVNGIPTAQGESYSLPWNAPYTVMAPGLLANDTDPESQALTAVKVTNPAHGSVTVNADGSFTYTPNANYYGTDSFTYSAHDGVGGESAPATVNLTVSSGYTLTAPATVVTGEPLTVTWTAPAGHPALDWIGIYPSNESSPSGYITWSYINGATTGTYTVTAPAPGTYVFRLYLNDGTVNAAVSNTVTVNATPPSQYNLTLSPATVNPGDTVTVSWNVVGTRTSKDWIGLYLSTNNSSTGYVQWFYTGGSASGSKTLPAPTVGGTYVARYYLNDSGTLGGTSNTLTVNPPAAPTVTPGTTTIATGGTITANWTAPAGRPTTDWVALVRADQLQAGPPQTVSGYTKWAYTGGATSGSAQLVLTGVPAGNYYLVYLLNNTTTVGAVSTQITVTP